MDIKREVKRFWMFLKEDSWQSWIVSLILMVVGIKFVLFPLLSLMTGAPIPLVLVESCSMYHESGFDDWWTKNQAWYKTRNVSTDEFENFDFRNGVNKGDVFLVVGAEEYKKGDIIIFRPNSESTNKNPIIHRIINDDPIGTKGDHNSDQLVPSNNLHNTDERNISYSQILGKAKFRIPSVGWAKLIFFEPFRAKQDRGFCK